ncbi:MAG: hypothetical protein IIB42_04240 [Candidatus Marinimicrobia bacterium]|nr:hypothetical protein [Candidatus Neomarinimicrobiota bacterium]
MINSHRGGRRLPFLPYNGPTMLTFMKDSGMRIASITPVLLISAWLVIAGCEETITPRNKPPVISSITAVPDTVDIGGTAILTAVADDADGDSLTYTWSADYGTLAGTDEIATWTAPFASGVRDISLSVDDGHEGQVELSVSIPVIAPSLISLATADGPTLDGIGNELAWLNAGPLVVTAGAVPRFQSDFGGVAVTLKSVHTDSDLYILASWTDPSGTPNVTRKQWSYNSGTSSWERSGADEDRLFFMFDAGDNGTEGADCATMCHGATDEMTTTGGGHVDVWHWKAARTNPVGLADDKWWDGDGRGSDAKTISAYQDNITGSGNFPKYAGGSNAYEDFIKIEVGETETDLVIFDSTDAGLQANTYPGYILDLNAAESDESRHDVHAWGRYAGGVWTVEFKRALDTGHTDDVVFVVGSSIQFSVAVTDNSGGAHSGAGVIDLVIK